MTSLWKKVSGTKRVGTFPAGQAGAALRDPQLGGIVFTALLLSRVPKGDRINLCGNLSRKRRERKRHLGRGGRAIPSFPPGRGQVPTGLRAVALAQGEVD